jgi:4-amino-4-deoxy-L-arabinose transferase-like glycosyltransferase
VVFAAFALRAHALGAKSFWYDELRQIEVAQQPLANFTPFMLLHAARPLDYVVTHALLPWGHQEFWLRLPALLWSTLAVAVFFALARRWLGVGPALWAAALLAAAPFAVQYAQELRPYALYLLISLLGVWTMERALAGRGRSAWLAFAATAAAGTLTHFFYALVLGVQGLYGAAALAWPPRRPGWRRSLAALAAAGLTGFLALQIAAKPEHLLLFTERFLGALGEASTGAGLVSDTGVTVRVSEAVNADFFLKGLLPAFGAGPNPAAMLLFSGLALLGLIALARRDRRRLALVGLWLLAAPTLVIIYLQYRQEFFALRYIIFALPAYLLLVAQGLAWLAARPRPAWARSALAGALLAGLLAFSLAQVRADYHVPKDDWRRVGAFLTANVRPGDTLGAPDVQAFIRFYAPSQPATVVDVSERGPHEEALADGERFWFVWSDYTLLPVNDTREWVNSLTSVTFQLDPHIKVIFVHPGLTQAEMLAEAEQFVVPPPSIK